jgi:hypothetical protein
LYTGCTSRDHAASSRKLIPHKQSSRHRSRYFQPTDCVRSHTTWSPISGDTRWLGLGSAGAAKDGARGYSYRNHTTGSTASTHLARQKAPTEDAERPNGAQCPLFTSHGVSIRRPNHGKRRTCAQRGRLASPLLRSGAPHQQLQPLALPCIIMCAAHRRRRRPHRGSSISEQRMTVAKWVAAGVKTVGMRW